MKQLILTQTALLATIALCSCNCYKPISGDLPPVVEGTSHKNTTYAQSIELMVTSFLSAVSSELPPGTIIIKSVKRPATTLNYQMLSKFCTEVNQSMIYTFESDRENAEYILLSVLKETKSGHHWTLKLIKRKHLTLVWEQEVSII